MRRSVRTVKLKGLWRHPKTGKPYHRSQKGGKTKLTPLPDLPVDHPDFVAAWAEAARHGSTAPKPKSGTLESTWAAVLASDIANAKSKGYQGILKREAARLCDKYGGIKVTAIEPRHIRKDVAEAKSGSNRLKAWRFWATYCLDRGWLYTDPTQGVKIPAKGDRRIAGHPCWSLTEIQAFRQAFPIGTTTRAIMELTYWTGARISDAVQIGPQHIDRSGVLVFTQQKTGDKTYVPWTCLLPGYAVGMEPDRDLCKQAVAHLSGGLTFLAVHLKNTTRARSAPGAGNDLSAACRAIGLQRSAHGLRKARAVALADAGATATQIAAWTGHRSLSEVAHYTREMDRKLAVMGTGEEHKSETRAEQSETRAHK